MAKLFRDALVNNLWFYILSSIAVLFLIASFIAPPLGVINASVLEGVAEIFAFASLGAVLKAIDKGTSAKIEHHNTQLTIENNKLDEK